MIFFFNDDYNLYWEVEVRLKVARLSFYSHKNFGRLLFITTKHKRAGVLHTGGENGDSESVADIVNTFNFGFKNKFNGGYDVVFAGAAGAGKEGLNFSGRKFLDGEEGGGEDGKNSAARLGDRESSFLIARKVESFNSGSFRVVERDNFLEMGGERGEARGGVGAGGRENTGGKQGEA